MSGVLPWYQQKKLDGVDPTFFADFVNNRYAVNGVERSFADVFTHTRASTKTFFGSNGLLQSAAVDAPVFDYDPVTLLPMGLDNEEQRTNLILNSEDLSVSPWLYISTTVTPDQAVAPDGTNTMDLISEVAASNFHNARQASLTIAAGSTVAFSCFVKKHSRDFVFLGISDNTTTKFARVVWSFTTKAFTYNTSATYTIVSTSYKDCGNGIFRLTLVVGTSVDTGLRAYIGTSLDATNPVFMGDIAQGVYAWGAQCEVGFFSTSYIPTAGATVTRSADLTQNNASNVAGFGWYTQAQGSVYEQYSINGNTGAGGYPRIWEILNAASPFNDFFIGIYAQALSNGRPRVDINAGGVAQMQNNVIVTQPVDTPLKMIGAATLNNGQIAYQGTLGFLDTAMTMPTNLDTLRLQVNMTHKDFRFYPIRGLDASIQAMTV